MKRAMAIAGVVGCGAATVSTQPPPPPLPSGDHDAAWVTAACTREYEGFEHNWATYMPPEKATSPFNHCPRWRMVAPGVCGAAVQPSFVDPCHCMCDLCERDSDCGPGASCVEMSSVICGGMTEHVCVREDDPCHPKNAGRCATHCVTLFGKPQCVTRDELQACR